MTHAICFDTLAYANKLKEAGVPSKQAELQSEALSEILEDRVASKQDIDSLKRDIDSLEGKMNVRFAELKAEMIKWGVGISTAQAAVIISVLKLFH